MSDNAVTSNEPWARGWSRHVLGVRLPRSTAAASTSRRRIVHLQRRPGQGHFSIERLFEDIRFELASDGAFDMRVRSNDYPSRGIVRRALDALRASSVDADVLHVTGDVHYLTLALDPARTVLTVHDCVSLHRLRGIKRAILKRWWYDLPVRRARVVTVISEFTRRELVAATGCDPAKVVVIPNHVSDEFVHVPKPFDCARPRVLHIGATPNKNLDRLVAALQGLACVLVVVGALDDRQRSLLAKSGLQIEHFESLGRQSLVNEYQRADIVAFVSTYEGFGLPILEAQASGRPVVTSNVCSMPEVAGEGSITVDPTDVQAIRAAFVRVIENAAHRDAVVAAGLRNVQRFRLPVVAAQYRAVYQQVGRAPAAAETACLSPS